MEINYFDIIVSIIILFLGLKGIINGFFKELFGLIGIVGGIFVASRLGNDVGQFLSDLIFNFENSSAINFTGFLTTLALFWLLMIGVGQVFKKLSSLSGLGALDQILGFVFGASKFFFIAAVIAHSAYNIKAVKSIIDDSSLSTSYIFPILTQTGAVIMKLDPVEISEDINKTTQTIRDTASKAMSDEILKEIQESMPQITQETSKKSDS
ncbi:MAG: membrane protein required for colicin V production [Sulfurimonas sp.]|jgi:membrane protein required for colicin V production|uniref:CvpA family protein n=1 Tax=Sulfurimonas sp. TaxID=2022749 RepID=UPI0039E5D9AC